MGVTQRERVSYIMLDYFSLILDSKVMEKSFAVIPVKK